MSYSCEISFKSIPPQSVYPFLIEFKSRIRDHIPEIAKENHSYCPIWRNTLRVDRDLSNITQEQREAAKNWALNSIFKYRYFYDQEHQMLGIYSVHNVPALREMFDGTVYFQNSVDQDYTRDAWEGIKDFEEIYDKCMAMSEEEVRAAYNSSAVYTPFGDLESEDFVGKDRTPRWDYYRRSLAYDKIWDQYAHTLYHESDIVYLSIFGHYELRELYSFIKHCHEAEIAWEDKEYPPPKETANSGDCLDDVKGGSPDHEDR